MTFAQELLRQQKKREYLLRLRLITVSPVAWCIAVQAALTSFNPN